MTGCSSNNINRNLIQKPKNVDSHRSLRFSLCINSCLISNEEMHALNREHAFTTLFNLFLSLKDEPIYFFSSKTFCVVVFCWETACVSKAQEWPRGWQMPGQCKIWKSPIPGTGKAGKCPAVARGGGVA